MIDPARFRKKLAGMLVVASAAALAAAPRIAMLFTVERRIDADESIVGLMAKHIAAGEKIPPFFYGQYYGGGHVIEALMSAPLVMAAGLAGWAVQLPPLLFSIATVLLLYLYVQRMYGGRAGLLAAALLSFSVPYLKSSLKADGYIETIFLCLLAFVLLQSFEHAYRAAAHRRLIALAAAMGAVLGLAWWSYDFSLACAVAVFAIALRYGLLNVYRLPAFIVGFAAGATPLIVANVTGDWAHLKHLAGGGHGGLQALIGAPAALGSLITREIPAFLTHECIHNFVYPAPLSAWALYAAIAAAGIILIGYRRNVPGAPALAALILVAAYSISDYAGKSPRYLLPLEPFMSLTLTIALVMLFRAKRYISYFTGGVIFALAAAGIIAGNVALFTDNSIVEGNVKTHPESLTQIVNFLDENEIKCVKTTYFIKWRLLFLSDERINAIDIKAHERETAYMRYEELGCPPGEIPGYVFHKSSRFRYMLAAEVNRSAIPYEMFYSADHIAVIPAPMPALDTPAEE